LAELSLRLWEFFWLSGFEVHPAKRKRLQLERRSQELTEELAVVRAELVKAHAESAVAPGSSRWPRAGKNHQQLGSERDGLRASCRRQKRVETQRRWRASASWRPILRNERQNLAEKLALLESAKQALAHQFEALAGRFLRKIEELFRGQPEGTGNTPDAAQDSDQEFRKKVEQRKPTRKPASPSWRR
jgi:hypothetical protein